MNLPAHAAADAAAAALRAPARPEPGTAGPLAVAVVEDARALDALAEEWGALLERSHATVFQTFEWQRTWWRHFGEGNPRARLHVVTLRDREGLVAIAPLHVERAPLGLVRRLRFVGHTDSDYLDVVAARGREAEAVERLARHLDEQRHRFDVAVLDDLPDGSVSGPLLAAALARRGWTADRHVVEQCPRTGLRATWDETLAGFGIAHRREVRRRMRNLEKAHRVELEVVPSGPGLDGAMREFIALHQERWLGAGYWGGFADPRRAAFHRDAAARLAARGWLFLAFLRADGARAAANYGFTFRGEVSTFLGGAREDAALRRFSPSRVLHAMSMEWAVRQGARAYDFMRGTEPYKYELDAEDVPNWRIVAYPRPSRLAALRQRAASAAETIARRTAREALVVRAVAREAGWVSPRMRAHLGVAVRRAMADVRRVLRRARPAAPGGSSGAADGRAATPGGGKT